MRKYLLKLGLIGVFALFSFFGNGQTLSPFNTEKNVPVGQSASLTFTGAITFNDDFHYIRLYKSGSSSHIEEFFMFVSGGILMASSSGIIHDPSSYSITINPSVDLEENTTYYILVPNNLTDTDGFSGTDESNWSFTTISSPPTINSLSPTDNSLDVATEQNLTITFNENITFGTGSETLTINDGTGSFQSFTVGDPELDITGSQLTITHDAFANSTNYHVLMDPGFVASSSTGTDFGGISDPATWNFTTVAAPPSITGLSPADDATNVSTNADLTITFNEDITAGTGYIELHRSSGFEAINISTAIISGNQLTIDASNFTLLEATDYHIEIEPGVITNFPGISDATTWNFTTEAGPPTWTAGYPNLSNQTASDVTLNGQTDQSGTYYYVITDSETYPSDAQIATGNNENDAPALIAGSGTMTASTTFSEENIDISTLDPGTYYIYSVADNGSSYSEVKRNTLDRVPPIFSRFKPDNGSIIVPVDTVISVTYSEKLYATDGTEIISSNAANYVTLSQGGSPVTCTGIISSDGKTITLTPDSNLSENTAYTVSFSAFEDQFGNESEAIADRVFSTDGTFYWIGGDTQNPTDLTDTDNWSGSAFVDGKSVIIQSSATTFPEITSDQTIKINNLTIEAGGEFTLNGGDLNITGLFTLESDINANASFIPLSGNLSVSPEKVRFHQHIEANNRNYNIGIPVNGTTKNLSGITNNIFEYDNANDLFVSIDGDAPLEPGKGYICRSDNSLIFTGTPITSDLTVNVQRNNSGGLGWNLIGNPFSATADFTKMNIDTSEVAYSFWIWDNVEGKYDTYNASSGIGIGIPDNKPGIPSHQAIWVKVRPGHSSSSITFTTSSLEGNDTTYLKSTSSTKYPTFKLEADFNGKKDETAIVFAEDALTSETDPYDTEKKLTSSTKYCQIFTMRDNVNLAINGLTPSQNENSIPLIFDIKETGTVTFNVKTNTLPSTARILLEDKVTNNFIDLGTTESIQVEINETGLNKSRFVLHFSGTEDVATNINEGKDKSEAQKSQFQTNNSEIIAYIAKLNNPTYKLLDVNGKVIDSGKLNPESENRIRVSRKGMIILIVESENKQLEFKTVF
jgi:methionine-rich copper-binding protein CopC